MPRRTMAIALACAASVTATFPLFQCLGQDMRVTGLRLGGLDPSPRLELHRRCYELGKAKGVEGGSDHEHHYKFPNSEAVRTKHARLEVDNGETALDPVDTGGNTRLRDNAYGMIEPQVMDVGKTP